MFLRNTLIVTFCTGLSCPGKERQKCIWSCLRTTLCTRIAPKPVQDCSSSWSPWLWIIYYNHRLWIIIMIMDYDHDSGLWSWLWIMIMIMDFVFRMIMIMDHLGSGWLDLPEVSLLLHSPPPVWSTKPLQAQPGHWTSLRRNNETMTMFSTAWFLIRLLLLPLPVIQ